MAASAMYRFSSVISLGLGRVGIFNSVPGTVNPPQERKCSPTFTILCFVSLQRVEGNESEEGKLCSLWIWAPDLDGESPQVVKLLLRLVSSPLKGRDKMRNGEGKD